MTTAAPVPTVPTSPTAPDDRSGLRRAFDWHRPLMTLAAVMAVLLVVCVVGLIVDDRTMTGVPIWTKPTKFALSTLIYGVTWAWLIALVRQHRPAAVRWTQRAGTATAILLGVELAIIVTQVVRGTTSHFNQSTPLNAVLYQVMAVSIVGVWLATLYATAQLFRVRGLDPARSRAIRSGAVVALVGLALGFLMTFPFPGQIAAGGSIIGAHTVGAQDGGAGLPFLGWSTVGGDLRIPHFIGMHALQALPLLLILLELLAPRIPVLRRVAVRRSLVGVAAVTYVLVLGLTTWQALRGRSIVAPDAPAVWAWIAIGAAALVATAAILLRRPPAPITPTPRSGEPRAPRAGG